MLRLKRSNVTTCHFGTVLYAERSSPFPSTMFLLDPLLRCSYRALVTLGPISVPRLFGHSFPEDRMDEKDYGYMDQGPYNGNVDWMRYGTTLSIVRSILRSDLEGRSFNGTGEHEVYHRTSVGDAIPYSSANGITLGPKITLRPDGRNVLPQLEGVPYGLDTYAYIYTNVDGLSITYSLDGGWHLNMSNYPIMVHNGLLFGRYSQGSVVLAQHNDSSFGGTRLLRCSNIRWQQNEGSFDLNYTLTITESSMYFHVDFDNSDHYGPFEPLVLQVHMHQSYYPTRSENSYSPFDNDNLFLDYDIVGQENWQYKVISTNEIGIMGYYGDSSLASQRWFATQNSILSWTNRTNLLPCSDILAGISPSGSAPVACTLFSREKRDIDGRFYSWFEYNLRDIRAASALSSADAMSDLQSSTDTDVMQTIAKIPQIASSLPKVAEAINVIRDLTHRELNIREVLDLITQTNLQYNFQWRPEFQILLEILPKIPQIMLAFPDDIGTVIGRGRYDYDFLPDECIRTCHLSVRTKIVAVNSFSNLTATYLKLDSIGVVPNLLTFWDLVPFSFVVNWFTNMGSRIRTIGSLANTWLLDPIVVVHSYTLTSSYTEVEKETMNIRTAPDAGSDLGLRIYKREVSRHLATYSSSRFDFERPTGTPSWSIVASLLWQWMK